MEYPFYAEQTYRLNDGIVQARVLTAQKSEALGYEDGYTAQRPEGRLYVDGFDSEAAARYHLESLTDCKIMNGKELRRWDRT